MYSSLVVITDITIYVRLHALSINVNHVIQPFGLQTAEKRSTTALSKQAPLPLIELSRQYLLWAFLNAFEAVRLHSCV